MSVWQDLLWRVRRQETGERRLMLAEVSRTEDAAVGWEYVYHILDAETGEQLGRMELRLSHGRAVEFLGNVGYSIRPAYRHHHYAAAACRLLAPVARSLGLDYLTITCDTDNIASRKTIESLGAQPLGILQRRVCLSPGRYYTHEKYNYRWELAASATAVPEEPSYV